MNFRSPLAARGTGVLSITPFRRLWIALSLSSLGDWLSLLALSALAYSLTGQHLQATAGSLAVSGVWITSLLPYLLFGPPYDAQAREAGQRGFQVRSLPGEHLHQVVDPGGGARSLLGLAEGGAPMS